MPSASSSDMHSASADGVDYPLAPDDRTRDAVHTIVSGRKSWKTLKGKGEAVWPPYLEAALVEALDRYRPETSRSTRSLSRFPNRNRFISDYIFHVTGKRRTAKQVGSRLQQLRDTCGGKRILKLLSNRDFSSIDDSLDSSSPSHGSPDHIASSTLTANGSLQPIIKPSRALVHIDVLPANAYWCPSPSSSLSDALSGVIGSGGIVTPPLSPSSTHHHNRHSTGNGNGHAASGAVSVFKSSKARPLRAIDPTVTFTSTTLMDARSSCSVYFNGNCIHTESTEMHCSSLQETPSYMYRASLVPQFWVRLCDSNEPGRYSIVQEIIQASTGLASEHVLLTVVYQLTEPTASSSSSPSYGYGDGGDCASPAPSSRSSNSGSGGSRSSSGSGMMSPVDMLGRNTTFELMPCNTSSFMNSLNAVNDLPITPVSATFSDHSGSGPRPNPGSHHLSGSHSHTHSGPLGHSLSGASGGTSLHNGAAGGLAALGGGADDGYFSTFDDLSSFGPLPEYATFGGGLGVGGGIGGVGGQWGGGGYSPASSFE